MSVLPESSSGGGRERTKGLKRIIMPMHQNNAHTSRSRCFGNCPVRHVLLAPDLRSAGAGKTPSGYEYAL